MRKIMQHYSNHSCTAIHWITTHKIAVNMWSIIQNQRNYTNIAGMKKCLQMAIFDIFAVIYVVSYWTSSKMERNVAHIFNPHTRIFMNMTCEIVRY